MVELTNRKAETIFNCFIIHENSTGLCKFVFPYSTGMEMVNRIIDFGPSCREVFSFTEHYILLFTDSEGRSEYGHCLQIGQNYFLCFTSFLPWFGCFHQLLDIIHSAKLYMHNQLHTLSRFLEELRNTRIPPIDAKVLSLNPPHTDKIVRLSIPTSTDPYFLKAVEHYYSSLDYFQWIEIFTSMLLEKSIIFHSKSHQRLTYSIIAAVSLLYPLSWVSPIYTILSRNLLPFLESPVPFIAGIHSGMLEEAKSNITDGTLVVDLDNHRILLSTPDGECRSEKIPDAILNFFGVEISDSKRFLKSAMNSKSRKFSSWKTSALPVQHYLEQQTRPFFSILVNLLGNFRHCLTVEGRVNFQKMIECQACPRLEPFLRQLFESQMIHCFFDDRLAAHNPDEFDFQARLISDNYKKHNQQNQPTSKINFGDDQWISSKRSSAIKSIKNFRLRSNSARRWVEGKTKTAVKLGQQLWKDSSDLLNNGLPVPLVAKYSQSMKVPGGVYSSNPTKTRYSMQRHLTCPSPYPSSSPPSIPPRLAYSPVLAARALQPPPPIPKKSWLKPNGEPRAMPSPLVPSRSLIVTPKPDPDHCTPTATWSAFPHMQQTPAPPPRAGQSPRIVVLLESSKRVKSTPEMLDLDSEDESVGHIMSSTSISATESDTSVLGEFKTLNLHPPDVPSRSVEHLSPVFRSISRESAV